MIKRIVGIDLLKIISMLMIITLHILGKGGLLGVSENFTIKGELIWLIEIFCYCSVNCYALASGYTSVNSNHHKLEKIILLWIQVEFYSVLGELVYILVNTNYSFSFTNIIKSFFPVITSKYWYFTSYFGMYFILPLLNGIIKKFERETLKKIYIYCLFIFCFLSSLKNIESIGINSGYSLLWLSFLYLIGAYLKEYQIFDSSKRLKLLLGYVFCSLMVWISKLIIGIMSNIVVGKVELDTLFVDYNNILILFASICLLGYFVKIQINTKYFKAINILSSSTFGIYILHLTPVVYEFLSGRFEVFIYNNVFIMVFFIILSSLMLFSLCLSIDLIRNELFKVLKVNEFCLFISEIAEKLTNLLIKI